MPSKKLIAGIIVIIIIAIIAMLFVVPLVSSSPAAVLRIEQGQVEVNNAPVRDGTTLKQGDSVRTLEGAKASIVLYGASTVRLDENTEIQITELGGGRFKISQKSGSTWNKVTQLSGFASYEVETPHALVATQGTAFGCRVIVTSEIFESIINTKTDCSVAEGKITMNSDEDATPIFEGQSGSVEKNTDRVDKITISNIDTSNAWISENLAKDQQFVEGIKQKIKTKYAAYIPIIKSQYGLTDQQIDEMLDGFLSGKYTQEQYESAIAELESRGIKISV